MTSEDKDTADAIAKLKRFCYLGSFTPVYTHRRIPVQVEYFHIIEDIVKPIKDEMKIVSFLNEMLHDSLLVRRDETIFVYATYLAAKVDIDRKTGLRKAFTTLITTDEDLFTFCKYSSQIGKLLNHKCFSRTVRKAIIAWYEIKTPEQLQIMWMNHRGLCGFTHKDLLKLCHISNHTLGSADVAKPFFTSCSALIKYSEKATPAASIPQNVEQPNQVENPVASVSTDTDVKVEKGTGQTETTKTTATNEELILEISKLRTSKKNYDALKIIRKYKIPFEQVPGRLLRYAPILTQLLPTMSHFQIFKLWHRMAHDRHLENNKIFKLCKSRLENKELAKKLRMHPIHFLMNLREIGVVRDVKSLPAKKVESFKMEYLNKLYLETFEWTTPTKGLRMHITVNLQSSYKKKYLKNHPKLNYYEACLALAYGYSKRAEMVDVFHWYEDRMKLKQIVFETKDAETAFRSFDVIENKKNNQRLVTPLINALNSPKEYDVFLCIVPTAGRGNPKQKSEFLTIFLNRYRKNKNPTAKFIILNLLKHRRSMSYSETENENILEICGLDEHTPDLIQNFATRRFE